MKIQIFLIGLLILFAPYAIYAVSSGFVWSSDQTNATTTDPVLIPDAKFVITGAGLVGIGTTNPSRFIHVYGQNPVGLDIQSSAAPSDQWYWRVFDSDNSIRLVNNDSGYGDIFTVLRTGKVGINATNPTSALYVVGNVSADSFTDRTPGYSGDALADIAKISNNPDGTIDHDSLPVFVRKDLSQLEIKNASSTEEESKVEPPAGPEIGRDLGAMISLQTAAIQQLLRRVENLEAR